MEAKWILSKRKRFNHLNASYTFNLSIEKLRYFWKILKMFGLEVVVYETQNSFSMFWAVQFETFKNVEKII